MRILILNWRDVENPLGGGAELSLFEHAKYWLGRGNSVTWFTSAYDSCLTEETREGVKIVRRGSVYTVHPWAIYYILSRKLGKFDVVVDCFHFLPFFTTLFVKNEKIVALINEVAGKLWFANLVFP